MDCVFGERATTREVYERGFRDIVAGAAEGLNGAILAYGQTSSGKTYSMSGSSAPRLYDEDGSSPSSKGIIHFALEDLFSQLRARSASMDEGGDECNYAIAMSYCEIYMERVNDLLRDGKQGQNLPVKEHAENHSFYVEGLRERPVSSVEEVVSLLATAERRRRVAGTRFNEVSSRSHTLMTLIIECSLPVRQPSPRGSGASGASDDAPCVTQLGRLVFVDLAGNERVEASSEYVAESSSINKSLFFLGKVIEKLAGGERRGSDHSAPDSSPHSTCVRGEYLPVRDSNLTRLLAVHLGGNSRTGLLVTLNPSSDSVEESLSTLRFARKASTIRCVAQPVFVSKEQSLIFRQQATIAQLHHEVYELRLWQRQQQEQHHMEPQSSGAACRVVQQLREENSRLRSSLRYIVEERGGVRRQGEAPQGERHLPQQEVCKRSDGSGTPVRRRRCASDSRLDGRPSRIVAPPSPQSDGMGFSSAPVRPGDDESLQGCIRRPASAGWCPSVGGHQGQALPDGCFDVSRCARPASASCCGVVGGHQGSAPFDGCFEGSRGARPSSASRCGAVGGHQGSPLPEAYFDGSRGARAWRGSGTTGGIRGVANSRPDASDDCQRALWPHPQRRHIKEATLLGSHPTASSSSSAGACVWPSSAADGRGSAQPSGAPAGLHDTEREPIEKPPSSPGVGGTQAATFGIGIGDPLRFSCLDDLCLQRPVACATPKMPTTPLDGQNAAQSCDGRQPCGLVRSPSSPSSRRAVADRRGSRGGQRPRCGVARRA